MRSTARLIILASVFAFAIGRQGVAGQALAVRVEFAPSLVEKFSRDYGAEQEQVLASVISEAISRASRSVPITSTLTVTVVVEDAAPTHPTRQQISDHPSLDATRTQYLGGAQLTGYVRNGSGHTVATVRYRHFAPTLTEGSISSDPWADARIAIDPFATKLVASCHDRSGGAKRPAQVTDSP